MHETKCSTKDTSAFQSHHYISYLNMLTLACLLKPDDCAGGFENSTCSFVSWPDDGSSEPNNFETLPGVYLQLSIAVCNIVRIRH